MGQEIGCTNADFSSIGEMKDPVSHFVYDLMRGYHMPKGLAFRFIRYGARDHARVPMAWNGTVNGGFNVGHDTWQCVNSNFKEINVERDLQSDRSVYRFYQRLLDFRRNSRIILRGTTEEYDHDHRQVIAYARKYEGDKLFVVGNFSRRTVKYKLPDDYVSMQVRFGNYEGVDREGDVLALKPYQAVVLG